MSLPTYFAPAERATEAELTADIGYITNNPLIDTLMSASYGLFAVLNSQRQIVSLNRTFLDLMGVENLEDILGLRPGEYLQCIHASEMPGGCGTSCHCSECGAVIAILAALDSDITQEGTCALSVVRNNTQTELSFQVKCCSTIIDKERFLLMFLQDITPFKEKAYEELKNIIETASDGFMSTDVQGAILTVNQSLCRMTGYTEQEIMALSLDDFNAAVDCTELSIPEIMQRCSASFETHYRCKDGRVINIEVSETYSPDFGGRVHRFIRDITQRKQDEEKLHEQTVMLEAEIAERQKAQEELGFINNSLEARIVSAVAELRQKDDLLIHQNRLAAMGELLTTISHHWRQPLNNVAAQVQAMQYLHKRNELTEEEMDKDIRSVLDILKEMSGTIDDFRRFFRKDQVRQEFTIRDVVDRCLAMIHLSLDDSNVRVSVLGDDQVQATGFPNEYAQSLVNILYNARDVLKERNISDPLIEITISGNEAGSVITIRDNGGGIPEDVLPHIFEPYFTTKGPATATGLGLYMAKTLIKRHMEGELTVRNVEGGAEFSIVL